MTFWQFGLIAALSFGLSWIAVRWSIAVAQGSRFLDHPDGARKTQKSPIPRLGGLAVATALSLSILTTLAVSGNWREMLLAAAVITPSLLAAALGFADDQRDLNPYLRLALQAAIGLTAWIFGTRISISEWMPVNVILTIVWIMIILNGINLLDNSDGLAGSTVLVAATASMVVALIFGQELVSLLAVTLIGCSAGFLAFNWHPARVYLGDSGAYFLGTSLALLVIRLRPEGVSSGAASAIALLIVGLPLLDTSFVVVRRFSKGIHPFTAGRDHLSHTLQGMGLNVPQSVALLQLVPIVSGSMAVAVALLVQPSSSGNPLSHHETDFADRFPRPCLAPDVGLARDDQEGR